MNRMVLYCWCGACEFIVIDGELKSTAGPLNAMSYDEQSEIEYRCRNCGAEILFSCRLGVARIINPREATHE